MIRSWLILLIAAATLYFCPWPPFRLIAMAGGLAWVVSLVWSTVEAAGKKRA